MSRPRSNGRRPTTAVAERVDVASLARQLEAERNNVELLAESLSQLELAMDDQGWTRLLASGEREFTRDGLRQITAACRLYGIKSPLIKRALILRQAYVFGQGVEISARANGKGHDGEQDVAAVLTDFINDSGNRRTLFGAEAQQRLERTLGTDGNLFYSLWTRPASGRVQVRLLPWDEITDVIRNPDDSSEPWFYRREWTYETVNPATGLPSTEARTALYPAIGYRPKVRPQRYGDVEVRWDAPVRHVKVNDLDGWRFGIPDAYAAIDWAKAYKEFLEDWAKLVKSLSRYAWRMTAKGNAQAAAIKARIAAQTPTRDPITGASRDIGGTAITPGEQTLEAIPKSGATIDSESGRPLAMMVASAMGVPVTMLLSDPGATGARAVAETLDQPTELEMQCRQSLHTDVLRDIADYVIRESVRAPRGALKGTIVVDDDRELVTLAGDTEATVDVVWPDLTGLSPDKLVDAVSTAAGTGVVPPEVILRLLLSALGVRRAEELVDALTDEDGNFLWPSRPPSAMEPDDELDVDDEDAARDIANEPPDDEDAEDDE